MPSNPYLIGFVGLSRLLESGIDFPELGPQLEARVASDPTDANALIDLATLLFFTLKPDHRTIAFDCQKRALQITRIYRLPPPEGGPSLRLLVIMAPGDLTANTPVDCMLEGAGIEMTLLYLLPGRPLPGALPDHDLIFVAIGESSENQILVRQLDDLPKLSTKPVVNAPARISRLTRDRVSEVLKSVPGTVIPATARADRYSLLEVQRQERALDTILADGRFPIIARPLDSHGGKNLVKLDTPEGLATFLAGLPDDAFYVSNFIDYRSRDGQFKKYRVVLLDGRPFACHMAISENWMIHYVNANMEASSSKRNEEEQFFVTFERDFAERHKRSLASIHDLLGLDFVGIDCAETAAGELLIFEVDNAMIVHALDDPDVFPYKRPAMQKVFAAFREMLFARAQISDIGLPGSGSGGDWG